LRLASQRAAHEDVVLDVRRQYLEDADRAPQSGIDVGIDQFLLACDALDHFCLAQSVDGLLLHQLPVRLTRPARGDHCLGVLFSAAELEDVLAETDVGGPFAKLAAACDVECRHGIAHHASSHCRIAAVTVVGFSKVERWPQSSMTTSLAPATRPAISSWSASGVSASCRPHSTHVRHAIRRRSSRPSGRPMIALCCRRKAALPTRSAIAMTISVSGSSSWRAA